MPVRFSVIIPTHRRSVLLARALSSLRSQQAGEDLEIIVVADVADPASEAVCQQWLLPQDMYIRRSGPPGPSASRNLGLQLATGRTVLFLDDDDAWQPDLLVRLASCAPLQQGQAVYFNCTVVKERRTSEGPITLAESVLPTAGRLTQEVYVKNQVHMSCFAFPRELLQGLAFDTHMRAYEDWDFLLSVFDRQMPVHVDIPGSRVHEVDDDTTDRRGSSAAAQDFNAVIDYLYVYRRHRVSPALQEARARLLAGVGLQLPAALL